jgi:hypothetical protein
MSTWQPPTGSSPQPPQYFGPTGMPPYAPPPPSNTWLWVLLAGGITLFLCCGGGVVGVAIFGMNIVAAEVADEVRDNPKFREHIGELQSLDVDFVATSAKNDEEITVFNARGDKNSGVLTVRQETDEDWNNVLVEASLRLKDGTTVQIVP